MSIIVSRTSEPLVTERIADFGSLRKLRLSASGKPSAWIPILAIVLFCIVICLLYRAILHVTGGTFTYALDDPYISASMAKNLVQHHVLGVTRYGFSSSSSSIIWPFLLAAIDVVVGVHSLAPFILNVVLGTILIAVCFIVITRLQPAAGAVSTLVALSAIILLTPLSVLVFGGLEHILHAIATIAFAYFAAVTLSTSSPAREVDHTKNYLLVFSAFVTLCRYEGVFIVVVVAMLLLARRRWKLALGIMLSGMAPILISGFVWKSLGEFFLPNSLLLKGGTLQDALLRLRQFPYSNKLMFPSDVQTIVGVACILFVAKFLKSRELWNTRQMMLVLFIFTTAIHLQVASVGWLYRYEAYLVALGLVSIACTLHDALRHATERYWASALGLIACLCFLQGPTLVPRSIGIFKSIPGAAKNIFDQNYQMARFLDHYYRGSVVTLNDIGATNYFADIRCLDIFGLGSAEITRLKREQKFNDATLADFVNKNDGQIAIIFDDWLKPYGGVPVTWTKVGNWKIDKVVVSGTPMVSFYATNPAETGMLIRNLRSFSKELPADVHQSGRYVEPD